MPPSIAVDLATTPILANRAITTGDNGCNYWWIEWGGELDTVAENERIRDELWGVVYGIWDHIKEARRRGLAVLLISADLDELIGLSDRIEVMLRGRLVGEFDPDDVTPQQLGSAMTGAGASGAEPEEEQQ